MNELYNLLTLGGRKHQKDVQAEMLRMDIMLKIQEDILKNAVEPSTKQQAQDIINWIKELLLYRALMNDIFDENDIKNETPMTMAAMRMGLYKKDASDNRITYKPNV